MLSEERYNQILTIVNAEKVVSVSDLVERLASSESTIRRDLVALDRMGKLNKVHGGATCVGSTYVTQDLDMAVKYDMNVDEKRAIASYASSLVTANDFVYVDAGSTCEQLCDIVAETRATYVTNSIVSANRLIARGLHVVILGGDVKEATLAVVGPLAIASLERMHFTKGFWGTNGASVDHGFTTPDLNEAEVKRAAMGRCGERYVLCDASKFSQISPITFANFEDATVITTMGADHRVRARKNVITVG